MNADSLKKRVLTLENDSLIAETYYSINRYYYNGNSDSALKYALKGLEVSTEAGLLKQMTRGCYKASSSYFSLGSFSLSDSLAFLCLKYAKELGDDTLLMRAYYKLALNFNRQKKDGAVNYYNRSAEYAKKTGNKRWLAYIWRDMGLYYLGLSDHEKEAEYYYKAEEIFRELKDSVYLVHCYCDISNLHRIQKNYRKALSYAEKAQLIADKLDNPYMTARANSSLSSVYSDQNKTDDAIKFKQSALKAYTELNSVYNMATTSYDIGLMYLNIKNYNEAKKYLTDSYYYFSKTGIESSLAYPLMALGRLNFETNNFDEAKKELHEAERLSIKYNLLTEMKGIYTKLAKLYSSEQDFKKANNYLENLIIVNDSIFNKQRSEQINRFEAQFELREKESLLELQKSELELQSLSIERQKIITYTMIVIAILLFIIAVMAFLNIRRRKVVNSRLKELDIAKSRFFDNISHEMRNPLTLIMSPLQKVTEASEGSQYYQDLKLAYNNSTKLLDRVNEILDLSKLEAGNMVLNLSEISLYKICHRIYFTYVSYAQYKNINLSFNFNVDKGILVNMDTEKFEKILNNLILNAFKYTGINGEITLEIWNEKELFCFSVKDNGSGIVSDDLPHIFDRYYQSQQKNISSTGGTGIGLTLALEYSKLFGGDINVDSNYGKGSTFTLRIPLEVTGITNEEIITYDETLDKPSENFLDNAGISTTKPNILIVDDDIEISRYLVGNLSERYNCITAPDGVEALRLLKISEIDLIISDVMMPNMDGFEFRKEVRANDIWRQYPFMMLTARSLEEDKITGFKLGIDDYIIKPFNLNELQARIENLIQNKKERDSWWKENTGEDNSLEVLTYEDQMLVKAEAFVSENLGNSELKPSLLASHLGYSQRQLERLLKKSSGFTPSAFIRELRLKRAYSIIEQRQFSTIKEVCYDVGINSPANFSTIFKERYGKSPSEV